MKERVVIVEDHVMVLEALLELFRKEPRLEVVGSAQSLTQFSKSISGWNPTVVLSDYRISDGLGTEVPQILQTNGMSVPVLLMSGNETSVVLNEAIMSGCDGFISKAVSSGTLLDAVLNVAAGASVVSRDALDHRVADPAEFTALSASEADVLRLIARGRTPADISAVLDLSPSETTLRTDAVVEKLRASTPLEAVVVASRNGLLDLWSD